MRFADAYAGDVIDKIYAGHFFEFFAQVIGADVSELCDFRQRKFVIRILVDEITCFPDFHRLGTISIWNANREAICGCHLYHLASSNFSLDGDALPALAIAHLILAEPKNYAFCFKQFLQSKSQSTRSAKFIGAVNEPHQGGRMEYVILAAVVSMMALYALIIAGCLKQPEW